MITRNTIYFLLTLLLSLSAHAANQELVFLSWSQYIEPELISSFEKKHDVKVKMVYFETDDTRDDLMIKTDGHGYDLILVNGPTIAKYKKLNWLQPIPKKEIKNLRHIAPKWATLFSDAKDYATPYFWGTTGIVYRKDLLGHNVDSWQQLFKPAEAQRGKVAMIKSGRDTIGMALKMLGYSANSENSKEVREAEAVLKAQKPFVRDYSYLTLDETSSLITGDIHIAMAYSGDALILKELNDNIEYVVPKEGGNIWVDYLVLAKHSNNKDMAIAFLNFINEPGNATKNAEYVYYATPNTAAEKRLPKDFLEDSVIYPEKSVLDKSETYKSLSPRAARLRNQIFSNIAD